MLIFPEKKRKEILQWLSSGDFIARHSLIGETHAEGTGQWLLEELQSWFDGSTPRVVICQGPGI